MTSKLGYPSKCLLPDELDVYPYLLINGGVAASRGHPHLLIEAITDGVRHVNTGVSVTSEDSPVQRGRKRRKTRNTLNLNAT